ncbi:CLUMA_CG021157, isoform A [Clunio marinus]|uniref:CLUMA_CG021157, isoform A n=1 Tax=Clunio marinus TaxID=568069 RepID=A0A1J1J721_9DIPT|nr:CLUMA_CG021157, isoform A [Clunio marinus]
MKNRKTECSDRVETSDVRDAIGIPYLIDIHIEIEFENVFIYFVSKFEVRTDKAAEGSNMPFFNNHLSTSDIRGFTEALMEKHQTMMQ